MPLGFVRVEARKDSDPENFRHGAIVYAEKLSPEQTDKHELVFVLETEEDYESTARFLLDNGVIRPEWTSKPVQLQKFLDSARVRRMIGHCDLARLTSTLDRIAGETK